MPSPPVVQAVRCRLVYTQADNFLSGSRFYLSYSGSAPSPANCITLAGTINTAWASHIAPQVMPNYSLTEVDVLDLASTSGSSGNNTTVQAGTRTGTAVPSQCCCNVEFNIARRYRGGKPRMYFPPADTTAQANQGNWSTGLITQENAAVLAFFTALNGTGPGSMGTLQHVNISFYDGVYTTTPPWRGPGYKYPPKYRTTPLVDTVEGYATKARIGSQKRRRSATTP